jgi:phage-related protein
MTAAMKAVTTEGLARARHLRGEIHEVRAPAGSVSYRVLFAPQGRRGQVLLALEAFSKKSQKTPRRSLDLAERRLRDWRRRGRNS